MLDPPSRLQNNYVAELVGYRITFCIFEFEE